MSLQFEPVWSWTLVTVTSLVMVGLVLWTYPARIRSQPPTWRRFLLGLRVAAATLLIFAMLRPSIVISEQDQQRSELVFLLDNSKSMNTGDGPGGLSRREQLVNLLKGHQKEFDAFSENAEIRLLNFSTALEPTENAENNAEGNQTAIGKVLELLREQEKGDRLLAVFLLTDGAQRAAGDDDVDPLAAAREFAEQKGVPVHAVPFGTSELSSSGLDLAVEDLSLDQPVTFERKTVPVRMQVRLLGAAGKKVRVRLLIEDRTGKSPGESGPLKEIPISGEARPFRDLQTRENAVTIPVELSFVAEKAGEYKIAAEVVPEDNEIRISNNRLETLISVRKGGLRVAYFDIPRPEQKFLRRLNETARIQLDTQVILPGRLTGETVLNPQLFEPGAYDVYLIGDIPASAFQNRNRSFLTELAQRVQEGAGLGMIGGLHNFGPGGYATTPLAELLPVKMSIAEEVPPDVIATDSQWDKPIRMLPVAGRSNHYLMRLSGSTNADRLWKSLPELQGANRLTPKSGAVDVLAETPGGDPLLLINETGAGRVLALALDETWKWYLHGYESEHQRFWQQLVLWLAHKEFESEQNVWVRVEPRNFPPLSKIPIEFGAQDDDGNPIPEASFTVDVTKPDGNTEPVSPQTFGDGGIASFTGADTPGDYWVRVQGTHNGQSLGLSQLTRFVVDSRDIELDNPAADPGLLEQLTAITGGTVIPQEEFGDFLTLLATQGLPQDLQRVRRQNLWDGWPLLLLFTLVLTGEWILRKLRGMV